MECENANAPDWGWYQIRLIGGFGFEVGETITISTQTLINPNFWNTVNNRPNAPDPTTADLTSDIVIRITPEMLINNDFNNDFTFGVDVNTPQFIPPATAQQSGSVFGYHDYEKGEVGFTAPTFIRVEPDPRVVLNGLEAGAVTKMTVRRQIEADDKVMLKNITPPSGSLGAATPSGQGFLIPNDFSKVQKSNALNIINQLKAKNAFDKPIEPGITKD